MKQNPLFLTLCEAHGLPRPEPEYRFHPERKWRFDWAFVKEKISLEIEGGAFKGPGHRNVGVFLRNIEKYSVAAAMGWCVIRCTTAQVESGKVFEWLKMAFDQRRIEPAE